jgi:hypothetical protein
MTTRGKVKNGVVLLEPGSALPEGADVTVTTVDDPAATSPAPRSGPKAGSAKGKVQMSDDFDEPLSDFAEYMK